MFWVRCNPATCLWLQWFSPWTAWGNTSCPPWPGCICTNGNWSWEITLYVQLLPHLCTQAVQLGWSSVPMNALMDEQVLKVVTKQALDHYNFSILWCICWLPRPTKFWDKYCNYWAMWDEKIKDDWYCCRKIPLGLVHALIIWSRFIPLAIINSSVMSPPWRSLLENDLFQQNLVLVAVDEAHCIWEWWLPSRVTVRCYECASSSIGDQSSAFQNLVLWSHWPRLHLPKHFKRSIFSSPALSDPVLVKLPLNWSNILSVGTKSTVAVSLAFW